MAISNATRLYDFGSGIGTAGAVLKVDNTNQRVGIGTTDPRGMLQVGVAITMDGTAGVITATTLYATTIGDSNTTFAGDGSSLTGIAVTSDINTNNIAISGITTVGTSITMRDAAINVTGVITATSFVGNITGDLTGNLTGTPTLGTGVTVYSSGIVSATSYYGDAANMDNAGISAGKATALAAFLS